MVFVNQQPLVSFIADPLAFVALDHEHLLVG